MFTVDAEDRVRRFLVLGAEAGNDLKLLVALGVPFQRESFLSFASSQVMPIQQLGHDRDTDLEATFAEFAGDLGARKIGPPNPFAHGITGNAGMDDVHKSSVETGKQGHAGFSAAPFFRERPGAEKAG